jgi:bifunctional oligoribonuclease and PAP phosphatase NrnA
LFIVIEYEVMNLNKKFQLAFSKLKSADKVLVVGHVFPDPDALSSIGAILELLIQEDVSFQAYASDKIEGIYSFIPHENLISKSKPEDLSVFSAIIVLDCASISRTGLEKEINEVLAEKQKKGKGPFIIEFDHHQPEHSYADLEIRLPDKASTTEIIYDFLQANQLEINKKMASCILIGLMSDTGHFIHPNLSFQALEVSSEMLLKGASLQKISAYIRGTNDLSALKIWGRAFYRLKFNPVTKLACTVLTKEDLLDLYLCNTESKLADIFGDIVSFISYLPGVRVALLLREETNKIKGSLRANNDNIDVSRIAHLFGGGGHRRASGFSISGKLKETESGWKVVQG